VMAYILRASIVVVVAWVAGAKGRRTLLEKALGLVPIVVGFVNTAVQELASYRHASFWCRRRPSRILVVRPSVEVIRKPYPFALAPYHLVGYQEVVGLEHSIRLE